MKQSDDELLEDVDGYEIVLEAYFKAMSPDRRTAFAASLAERFNPDYRDFCAASGWGKPDDFRKILDDVWRHAAGSPLPGATRTAYAELCIELAPDQDEFDAAEALEACMVLAKAVDACRGSDNVRPAIEAALIAYNRSCSLEGIDLGDADYKRKLWTQAQVQAEIGRQFELLRALLGVQRIDERVIDGLKRMQA